jgi:hypothetical protein
MVSIHDLDRMDREQLVALARTRQVRMPRKNISEAKLRELLRQDHIQRKGTKHLRRRQP